MRKKFFDPIRGALYLADKDNSLSKDIIQSCEEVNQEEFEIEKIKKLKRYSLRRRNAFFGEQKPPSYFSIDDNKLYSGNYDLRHFTNDDLIKQKETIFDV